MIDNLVIPIYLNEKIVFDLLAIIEDGFSQISEVKSSSKNISNVGGNVDSSIKSSNILSTLFGVALSAKISTESQMADNNEKIEKRVHTQVSLFSKMRKKLIEEELIKQIFNKEYSINDIKSGDFVEIEGTLYKSPMIETMETIIEVFDRFINFIDEPQLGNKKSINSQKKEYKKVMDQIKAIYSDLTKTNTIDLIMEMDNNQDLKVLLSAQMNYFVNELESELIDGKYRILGKVIKVIDNDDSDINLFRKTSFKIFQDTLLDSMINEINSQDGIEIPQVISKIKGPGIIVIPIAIYA